MPTTENYAGNSHAARKAAAAAEPEERKIAAVVTSGVVRQKKPFHKRFMENFFGAEDAAGVASSIVQDVIIPGIKEIVSDAVISSVERALFGESSGRRRGRFGPSNGGPVTNYSNISTRAAQNPMPARMSQQSRETHNFDEIVLNNRIDAENVINHLKMALEQYESVSVADLYALVNQQTTFQDRKWGWEGFGALNGARAVRVKNGFLLDLPQPTYIN